MSTNPSTPRRKMRILVAVAALAVVALAATLSGGEPTAQNTLSPISSANAQMPAPPAAAAAPVAGNPLATKPGTTVGVASQDVASINHETNFLGQGARKTVTLISVDPSAVNLDARRATEDAAHAVTVLAGLHSAGKTTVRPEEVKEFDRVFSEATKKLARSVGITYFTGMGMAVNPSDAKGPNEENADLQSKVAALEGRVTSLTGRLDGQSLFTYGVKQINIGVAINVMERSIRLYNLKSNEPITGVRSYYDAHSMFLGRAHQASRSMVFVTERDRHLCVWLMDVSGVWPSGDAETNEVKLELRSNVPTKCGLSTKGVVDFLVKNTNMTDAHIVGLLQAPASKKGG